MSWTNQKIIEQLRITLEQIEDLKRKNRELISEFLSEFALLEHEIFVKLYNYFLVKLDNPTQKIILEKEYFDNVFRDFRNYTFYPRKEKYEKRLKE